MSYRFGSSYIRTTADSHNHRVISVSFDTSGDFVPCDEKILLGGCPLSLAKRSDGKYALMAINDVSASESEQATVLFGTIFSLSETGNGYAIPYSSSTPDYIDGETILAGMPIALGSNKELIVVAATGQSNEQVDFFLGGMPIIARRIGNDWYLVMTNVDSVDASSSSASSRSSESSSSSIESSSSSSRRSSSSSSSRSSSSSMSSATVISSSSSMSSATAVCDCDSGSLNTPVVSGGGDGFFCTAINGTYAFVECTSDATETIWTYFWNPDYNHTLTIRKDNVTDIITAKIRTVPNDNGAGAPDDVTAFVSCSGGDLVGEFDLTQFDPDELYGCTGTVHVVL